MFAYTLYVFTICSEHSDDDITYPLCTFTKQDALLSLKARPIHPRSTTSIALPTKGLSNLSMQNGSESNTQRH